MWVAVPDEDYSTRGDRAALWQRLTEALAEVSTVDAVGVSSALPFDSYGSAVGEVEVEGRAPGAVDELPTAQVVAVGPTYFSTLGLGILRGRSFHPDERANVVVDQRFADVHFPDSDPVGRRVRISERATDESEAGWATIVGVSPIVGQQARILPAPVVYRPIADVAPVTAAVIVRSDAEPTSLVAAIRSRLQALDPNLPAYQVDTMAGVLTASRWNARMSFLISLVIAVASIGVAAVGLYAVTAHALANRMRELGVRIALGARRPHIAWVVLRRTAVYVMLGVGTGSGLAAVSSIDTGGYLVEGAALFVMVALLATVGPIRRATRLDPVAVLRCQ